MNDEENESCDKWCMICDTKLHHLQATRRGEEWSFRTKYDPDMASERSHP